MVPGAGISVIARDLCAAGYTNVHASDIDEGALAKQREYGVKQVSILDLEAGSGADEVDFGMYDVVIDSSVADVFFAGPSNRIACVYTPLRRLGYARGC